MGTDNLIKNIVVGKRVCPVPMKWKDLWVLLPKDAPKPLILAAWRETTDMEKKNRFIQHINIAESHGILDLVEAFLIALTEEDWHHCRDQK